jgi:dTMP kinase
MKASAVREHGFRMLPVEAIAHPNGSRPVDISIYPGHLIALEGTDGVGRSTQIALLREWLEALGYGVLHTGLARSRLAGEGLRKAKQGTTLGQRTLDLFYATDFADRLETDVLPALRAGFVVLADRYIYSMIARSMVRRMDRNWLGDVYRFAPVAHGVFYLKVDIPHLVPRVLARGGFDFWESGLDFQSEQDLFSSFVPYQTALLGVFDDLASSHGFQIVDANRGIAEVFADLKAGILPIISGSMGPRRDGRGANR